MPNDASGPDTTRLGDLNPFSSAHGRMLHGMSDTAGHRRPYARPRRGAGDRRRRGAGRGLRRVESGDTLRLTGVSPEQFQAVDNLSTIVPDGPTFDFTVTGVLRQPATSCRPRGPPPMSSTSEPGTSCSRRRSMPPTTARTSPGARTSTPPGRCSWSCGSHRHHRRRAAEPGRRSGARRPGVPGPERGRRRWRGLRPSHRVAGRHGACRRHRRRRRLDPLPGAGAVPGAGRPSPRGRAPPRRRAHRQHPWRWTLITAAAIAVVGSVGAIAISIALSPLSPVGLARRAEPDPGVGVDPRVMFVGGLAAVVVALLIALGVAARHRHVLAPASPGSPSALPARLAAQTSDVAVATGLRFAGRRTGSRAATQLTVALACLTVVASLTFATSAAATVREPERYGWGWALSVGNQNDPVLYERLVEGLADHPTVGAATAVHSGCGGSLDHGDGHAEAPLIATEPLEGSIQPQVQSGQLAERPRRGRAGCRHRSAARSGGGGRGPGRIGRLRRGPAAAHRHGHRRVQRGAWPAGSARAPWWTRRPWSRSA